MELSKDWGSTTTWFSFAVLGVSSYLLVSNLITATDWMVVNGLGTAGVAAKGVTKVIKNGKAPAPAPAP